MELNKINILINKYFDGETTLSEEQTIATYLATEEHIPAEHIAIKAMFEAMGLLKEIKAPQPKPRKRSVTISRFRGVAAAVACIFVGVFIATRTITNNALHAEPMIICYVDGTRVNDQQMAEDEMRRILGNMNENVTLAMASIDKVNILKTK